MTDATVKSPRWNRLPSGEAGRTNWIFALALADAKTSDVLRPDRERDFVQTYEEYANGGLELVQSWIDRYSDLDVEDAVWRGLATIGVKPPLSSKAPAEVVAPTF